MNGSAVGGLESSVVVNCIVDWSSLKRKQCLEMFQLLFSSSVFAAVDSKDRTHRTVSPILIPHPLPLFASIHASHPSDPVRKTCTRSLFAA